MKRFRWSAVLWILPGGIAWLLSAVLPRFPEVTERVFARGLFRAVSAPLGWITSLLPVSLTEAAAILALPAAIWLLVRVIRRLRRTGGRRRWAIKRLRQTAWALSLLFAAYMLLHGLNFYRQPVATLMELDTRPQSGEFLQKVCADLAQKASAARAKLTEDADGNILTDRSAADVLRQAEQGYRAAQADYPFLWGGAWQPKPVRLSHWWSYTGITGMYFPFFAEANVNIDTPLFSYPFAAAHELAHTRGFAREDECNFLAYLTCTYQQDPLYRYSGLFTAYIYCENALFDYDEAAAWAVRDTCSEAMKRDLQAQNAYWKQFEGEVRQVSTQVNDAFLSAQGQQDGVWSYSRVVALIMAHYQTVVWG